MVELGCRREEQGESAGTQGSQLVFHWKLEVLQAELWMSSTYKLHPKPVQVANQQNEEGEGGKHCNSAVLSFVPLTEIKKTQQTFPLLRRW